MSSFFKQEHVPAHRENWSGLLGCHVEVHHSGDVVAAGLIDAVSPNGDLIWIAAEGADTRKIYDKASGYEIWT